MLESFERFVVSNFMKVPSPVRIIAYLVVLVVWVYLALLPHFIYGKCFIEDDGKLIPFRGETVAYTIEGKTMKFRVNEDGDWSVPMISKIPKRVELAFLMSTEVKDSNGNSKTEEVSCPVVIPLKSLWLEDIHEVVYRKQPKPGFYLVWAGTASSLRDGLALAFARIGEKLGLAPAYGQTSDEVRNRVCRTIARSLSINPSTVTPSARLREDLRVNDSIKRVRMVTDLEREFNIRVRDETWDRATTVTDIVVLIQDCIRSKACR